MKYTITYHTPPIDEAALLIGYHPPSFLEGAILLRHLFPPPTWLALKLAGR